MLEFVSMTCFSLFLLYSLRQPAGPLVLAYKAAYKKLIIAMMLLDNWVCCPSAMTHPDIRFRTFIFASAWRGSLTFLTILFYQT